MSAREVAAVVLLGIGIVAYALATLGQLVSRNSYDRLHAGGIANVVTTLCVVAAIVVEKLMSAAGIKALLIGLVFWIGGPIVSHVTARATNAQDQR